MKQPIHPCYLDRKSTQQMKDYKEQDSDLLYDERKICEISTKDIETERELIKNTSSMYFNDPGRGWIYIFDIVLNERYRINKLNKLINNIK